MNGFVHRLERLRWGCLKSPGSLCTGVGVAGSRQEVGVFLAKAVTTYSQLRVAVSRRRIPASCPFLEIAAGLMSRSTGRTQGSPLHDFLAANIAMSERSFALNQPCGDLAQYRRPAYGISCLTRSNLRRTYISSRESRCRMGRLLFRLNRSVTNLLKLPSSGGLGLKSGPIVLR
jgi:hypothetical protein